MMLLLLTPLADCSMYLVDSRSQGQKFSVFLIVVDHHLKAIPDNVYKSVRKSDK